MQARVVDWGRVLDQPACIENVHVAPNPGGLDHSVALSELGGCLTDTASR